MLACKFDFATLDRSLLTLAMHECAVESIWYDQLFVFFFLNLSHFLLNFFDVFKLCFAQIFVSLLKQDQHLSVVEGKSYVSNLKLFWVDILTGRNLLCLLNQILLQVCNKVVFKLADRDLLCMCLTI